MFRRAAQLLLEGVAAAVQLSSANADDTDEINRCSLVISTAVTGA